eukprot:gene334-6748_t
MKTRAGKTYEQPEILQHSPTEEEIAAENSRFNGNTPAPTPGSDLQNPTQSQDSKQSE